MEGGEPSFINQPQNGECVGGVVHQESRDGTTKIDISAAVFSYNEFYTSLLLSLKNMFYTSLSLSLKNIYEDINDQGHYLQLTHSPFFYDVYQHQWFLCYF